MRIGFAIPGDLDRISGGTIYDRRLIAEAAALGWTLEPIRLGDGFPAPSDAELAEARALLRARPGPLLIDGLAYGAFPEALAREVGPRTVALVHHPLCLETGLSPPRAAALEASERAALAAARGALVTSGRTAEILAARFGAPRDRVAVAPPGRDRKPQAPLAGDPPRILSVGAVIPRKGYDRLVAALAPLRPRPWRLDVVGPLAADPACAARLRADVAARGLADRIALPGPNPELDAVFQSADLYVSTAYYEGFGMAVTEAAAHGLPAIATADGPAEDARAGLRLVAPETEAVTAALAELLDDAAARRALGRAAWAAAQAAPSWGDTARAAIAGLARLFDGEERAS